MSMSNYPNGFETGVLIRGVPLTQTHPGRTFWVSDSSTGLLKGEKGGADVSSAGTFHRPFATVSYAISRCFTDRGDKIFVKPRYTGTLGSAAAIAASVAGVAVIGLGSGSNRPTFTFDTATTATLTVTAANVAFSNCRFVANFADIATLIDVSAAGDGLTFQDCLFTDTSTILNAVDFITLATGANDFAMYNCKVVGKSASNDSVVTGVAHDGFVLNGCHMQFDVAQTAVVAMIISTGNVTNYSIKDCFFRSNVDAAEFIDFNGTANSGETTYCRFSSLDVAGAVTACMDATGGHTFESYVAGEADTYGIVGGGTAYNNA